jgi:NAD-dependent deacetylase
MDGYQRFLRDPATAWREMLARRESNDEFAIALREALPNEAHFAIARLEAIGVLKHTITQNIDNLHYIAGSVSVTEIHGNRTKLRCTGCERRWPGDAIDLSSLPPLCTDCDSVIKSDTVMFGEPIPPSVLRECQAQTERADCMLIAGTSATVTPAAWFPEMVLERGGALVEVNPEPTPFSRRAVASLRGPAGEMLPALAEAVAKARA